MAQLRNKNQGGSNKVTESGKGMRARRETGHASKTVQAREKTSEFIHNAMGSLCKVSTEKVI